MPKKSVIPQKFSKTDNLWVLPKICKSGQSDVGQSVVYYCTTLLDNTSIKSWSAIQQKKTTPLPTSDAPTTDQTARSTQAFVCKRLNN